MLEKIWYGNSRLKWLLWPFSLIYKIIVTTRAKLYQRGILKAVSFHVPIIVVGNITVGGTGKTPFCIALCELLKKHGFKPGLVSRGYGGKATTWPQIVTPSSDPVLVGDEPVLLVKRTQCPMVVGPDRVAAVAKLLSDFDCNVVVSDDGLQHYRLARDIEIVLQDSQRGVGNGLCLPAGPLREPISRLKKAYFIAPKTTLDYQPICSLVDSAKIITPDTVKNKTVCALAGIGNPGRFFEALSTLGFVGDRKIFSDHHAYQPSDIAAIKTDIIIMTEKDAVKCRAFCDERCYALPLVMTFSHEFSEALLRKLEHNE